VNADSSSLSGWAGDTNSTESISAFGHSLDARHGVISKDISGLVTQGKQYTLTFWAKSNTTPVASSPQTLLAKLLGLPAAEAAQTLVWDWGPFTASSQWSIVTLGPKTLDQDVSGGVTLRLSGAGAFFIDNVSFLEVQDTFFVKKNTWVTPNTCLPQHLRCSAYSTSGRQTAYLTGFSSLCRAEAVGCQPLVDTRNSLSPRALTVTAGDQTVAVPEDAVAFRVYNTKKSCASKFAGCRRVGLPVMSSSGAVTNWSDVFTVLDPDTFDPGINLGASPLCSSTQNMCQVFTDAGGVQHYFKDPGSRLCEYSERCNLVTNPSFELLAAGTTDDGNADSFVGWGALNSAGALEAISSFNGIYWGANVLRLPLTADGIETAADITFANSADRLIAVVPASSASRDK